MKPADALAFALWSRYGNHPPESLEVPVGRAWEQLAPGERDRWRRDAEAVLDAMPEPEPAVPIEGPCPGCGQRDTFELMDCACGSGGGDWYVCQSCGGSMLVETHTETL